jgi:hypothetical protein
MVSLLLAYENAGQSEEVLAVFDQYFDPALCAERVSDAIAAGSTSGFLSPATN